MMPFSAAVASLPCSISAWIRCALAECHLQHPSAFLLEPATYAAAKPTIPKQSPSNCCKLARHVGSQTALRSQMLECMMMRKLICPQCWRHSNSLAQVWRRSQGPCPPGVQACRVAKEQIQEHEIRSKKVHGFAVQVWERPQGPCPPYVPGMQHCHIGSKTVVEGMWQRLGRRRSADRRHPDPGHRAQSGGGRRHQYAGPPQGPGHYTGTPLPGQVGNAAIAGHRTTYGHPFYNLDSVKVGDPIVLTTLQGIFVYDATKSVVVSPSDTTVLDNVIANQLTLTTCNPRFSASTRLVVQATLAHSQLFVNSGLPVQKHVKGEAEEREPGRRFRRVARRRVRSGVSSRPLW